MDKLFKILGVLSYVFIWVIVGLWVTGLIEINHIPDGEAKLIIQFKE